MATPLWAIPQLAEVRATFLEGSSQERADLTEQLWLAGDEALPLVEIFLESEDPETRKRADFLHRRILLGLRPDSPEELLNAAEKALESSESNRPHAVELLLEIDGGFEVAVRLLDRWSTSKSLPKESLRKLAGNILYQQALVKRDLSIPMSLACRGLILASLAGEGSLERRLAVKVSLTDPLAVFREAETYRSDFSDALLLELARGALLLEKKEDSEAILAMRGGRDRQRIDLLLKGKLNPDKEPALLSTVLSDLKGENPADIEALRASGYDDPKMFSKVLCALGHSAEAIEVLHDSGLPRRVLGILVAQRDHRGAIDYLESLDEATGSDEILEARLFLTKKLIAQNDRDAAQRTLAPLFKNVPKRVGHRQKTVALAHRVHDLEKALTLSRSIRPGFGAHEMVGDMGSLFPGRGVALALWTDRLWKEKPGLSAAEALAAALFFLNSPGAYDQASRELSTDDIFEKKALQEMATFLHRPEIVATLKAEALRSSDGHLLLPAVTDRELSLSDRLRACRSALAISPTSPVLHAHREILTGEKATRSSELALDDPASWIQVGKAWGSAERTRDGYHAFEKALRYSSSDPSFELLKRLGLWNLREDEQDEATRLLRAALIIGITDGKVRCSDLLPIVQALR